MKIAVMPGDGVGKEVVAEGLKVLKVAAQRFGFRYDTTDYPFGAEHYLETGVTLPDSALKEIGAHDAILFGAVGADPRGNAKIPQGLIETDILLRMRFELDQYDLVVTSHHAFANRVRSAGAKVLSYTHSPARWLPVRSASPPVT